MANVLQSPRVVRFGVYEVDLRTRELRKNGIKLKLSGQPFQVLAILLERPGDVVTRDELQKRLWPDTFVDVERNLNTAINKIREALADSAETPRFVETLPRRGYRFIAPLNTESATPVALFNWGFDGAVPLTEGTQVSRILYRQNSKSRALCVALLPRRWRGCALAPVSQLFMDSPTATFSQGHPLCPD